MNKKLTITFSGDLAFDEYTSEYYKDNKLFDDRIENFLKDTDYTVLNYESPITTLSATTKKSLYHKSSPESLKFIEKNFKNPILSLANNHMQDYGINGLVDTLKYLNKKRIDYVGAGHKEEEASKYIIVGEEIKVGILALQYYDKIKPAKDTPGVFCERQSKILKNRIKELKTKVDYIVLIYHGGYEFINVPLKFTKRQLRKYIDIGVDVVVSHHSHLVQGYEKYKGKFIFYSLGNFIFDTDFQRAQIGTEEGILLKLNFYKKGIGYTTCGTLIDRTKNKINSCDTSSQFIEYNKKIYTEKLKEEIMRVNQIKINKDELEKKIKQKEKNNKFNKPEKLELVDFNEMFSKNYGENYNPIIFKRRKKHFRKISRIMKRLNNINHKQKKKNSILRVKMFNKNSWKILLEEKKEKLNNKKQQIFLGKKTYLSNKKTNFKYLDIFKNMPILSIEEICSIARINVPVKYHYISNLSLYKGNTKKAKIYYEIDNTLRNKISSDIRKFVEKYNTQMIFEKNEEHLLETLLEWLYKFGPRGFTYNDYFEYELYNKTDKEAGEFLGGRFRNIVFKECNKDKNSRYYFKNKGNFNRIFSKFVNREWIDINESSLEEFISFTTKHPVHFVKPIEGTGGYGAHVVDSNGKDLKKLYELYQKENLIIEEIVQQHKELAKFNESTLNTLRIYSLIDANNKAKVLFGVARFGRSGLDVDNFHSGGVATEIDVETGIISSNAINIYQEKCTVHPDSKIKFKGFQIPFWEKIVESVEEAAMILPNIRHVGWDVTVNNKGQVEFIEGNSWPNFDVAQSPSQIGKRYIYEKKIQEIIDMENINK